MVIPRIKQNKIAGAQVIFPAFAPEMALSALDKADDVKIVKMIGKFLDDAAKLIGFNPQIMVVINMSLLLISGHGMGSSLRLV